MNIETGTALAIPMPADTAALFRSPAGVDALITQIEQEVRSHAPDLSTAKGRAAIKSLAYKVSQTKTALDEAGKALNDEARKHINAVDTERRKIRDRLDALRDEARKPLDDWEAAEERRIAALKDRFAALDAGKADAHCPSEQIRAVLTEIEATEIGEDWQEYQGEAAIAKDRAIAALRQNLAIAEKREADARELEELRRLKAERDEADRIAAEKAAEEQRRIEAEKAEAERQARIEREKQEAAEKAARDAEERAAAEAERVRREYEEKAEAERRAAAEREAEYKRNIAAEAARAEAAARAERDRIAAERKAEEDARKKREADATHRAKIVADISGALRTMAGRATPEAIAEALIEGKIPHCTVRM